jgi:hypothetical protein
MITAVDSSVVLDILTASPQFGHASSASLKRCGQEGRVIACDVVWAEVGGWFSDAAEAERILDILGIDFSPLDRLTALAAGGAWRQYRLQGGSRERMVADFLVGAHASLHADRLLTRDHRFQRRYFPDLRLLDPSAP